MSHRQSRLVRHAAVVGRWLFSVACFLALTAAVTYPWFTKEKGLLFLLDFVWPPVLPPPSSLWATGLLTSIPHEWLWWALSTALPTPLVQKIVFSLPLLVAGLSMFHLAQWILNRRPDHATAAADPLRIAAIAAGVFYALNPFMVTRVFMGQYYVLLAYGLTPWALLAFLVFRERPTPRRGLIAGLAAAGVMLTNAHHLFLVSLLLAPFAVRRGWRAGPRTAVASFLAPFAAFLIAAAAVRWFGSPVGSAPLAFNPLGPWARALQAPWSGNLLLDSLALTATWKLDLPFAMPYEVIPAFGVFAVLLLATMAVGAASGWRDARTKPLVKRILIIGGGGLLLAIGVAHPITEPFAAALYRHVPFWIGLRDSGKFLALVALAESAFLGLGIATLSRFIAGRPRIPQAARAATPAVALAAVLFLAAPAFRGFGGQITPATYPASWTQWNDRLAPQQRPRVLFLPWHQYLPFSFTDGRTVVNPAPRFFTNAEVIAGDNSEVGGTEGRPFIPTESDRPLSREIAEFLRTREQRRDFAALLRREHIAYVALAKYGDMAAHEKFLARQAGLTKTFESPELDVWDVRNQATPSQ